MARARARERPLRVLISAGPTREPIDRVRFVSNYSTGMMGACLAQAALARGHHVQIVHGPVTAALPAGARRFPVERTEEMAQALQRLAPRADVIVMAAAVADFTPVRPAAGKLPRGGRPVLRLRPTRDIIASLPRRTGQVRVGFALESGAVLVRAAGKLRAKRLDLVVAQQLDGTGGPFGRRPVRAWLMGRDGAVVPLGRQSKTRVAGLVLDKVEALWYGQRRLHAC